MTAAWEPDGETAELTASVGGWLATLAESDRTRWSPQLWSGLASLGVLGIGSPVAGGDATTSVHVAETLGRFLVGGPLVATTFVAHAFSPEDAVAVVEGHQLASFLVGDLLPWGGLEPLVVDLRSGEARVRTVATTRGDLDTLDGEPWQRVETVPGASLGPCATAVEHAGVFLAGYVCGAGLELVRRAAEHARNRHQFGQPIGDFQAVAHPLAECQARLDAASALSTAVARALADGTAVPGHGALATRAATLAALASVRVAHQTFAGLGYSVEGGVGRFASRIRQWTLMPPAGARAAADIATILRERARSCSERGTPG